MKTCKLITFAVAVSLSGTATAQSFNTISNSLPFRKVEQSSVPINENITSASDTLLYTHTRSHEETSDKASVAHSIPHIHSPLGRNLVVTSHYGWRKDPFSSDKTTFHSGIDLRARHEPVYTMLAGEVIRTGYDDRSGHFVTLKHGDFTVSYCHLSFIGTSTGTIVHAGEAIAMSGGSGASTSPHLHISARYRGKHIDPSVLLRLVSSY